MRNDTKFLKLVLVLSVIGVLVAGWLLSIHIKHTSGAAGLTEGCSIGSLLGSSQGCSTVAVSKYSDVFGLPLAGIAMGYYFAMFFLVAYCLRNYQAAREALLVSYLMASGAIVVTMIMFIISKFVLNSFCPGCAMLWVINLAIWPCLVKQQELSWGSALSQMTNVFRLKEKNYLAGRFFTFGSLSAFCVLLVSLISTAAMSLQKGDVPPAEYSLVEEYKKAKQVFLPPESVGGLSAKGLTEGTPIMEIVEFADLECPHCRTAAQFFKPFVTKNKDKVRLTFHHFPLDGSCNPYVPNGQHVFACALAKSALCSGDKFWSFHDQAFDAQQDMSKQKLASIMEEIGVTGEKYENCMKDPATENQLLREMQWADMIGLQSTPTAVVNGRMLMGARPPAEWEKLLSFLESEKK